MMHTICTVRISRSMNWLCFGCVYIFRRWKMNVFTLAFRLTMNDMFGEPEFPVVQQTRMYGAMCRSQFLLKVINI